MNSWRRNQSDGNYRQDSGWGNQQPYNRQGGHSHNDSGRDRNRQQSYGNQQGWDSNRFHGHDRTHRDQQFTQAVPTNNNVPQMNQKIPKKQQHQNQKIPKKQQQQNPGYHGQNKQVSCDDKIPSQPQEETNSSNYPMEISKDFFEMTFEEKINSQFPKYEGQSYKSRTFQDIPVECQDEDDDLWKAKKKKAAEVATEKALLLYSQKTCAEDPEDDEYHSGSSLDQSDDDGYESWDDGTGYGNPKTNLKRKVPNPDIGPEEIKIFFKALQHNVLFDMGWRVNGFYENDTKNCWCPCSRHMEPWHIQFKLTSIAGKDSEAYCSSRNKGSTVFEPIGLMGHIESMSDKSISSQVLHYGIREYLQSLYGDKYGDIGHKCLYKMGDENYKKSEAYERKNKNRMIIELKMEHDERIRQLEVAKQEKEAHEEQLKKLGQINEDLVKKVEKLESDKNLLDVKGKKESKEISKKDSDNYNNLRLAFFKNLKATKPKKATESIEVVVPSTGFNLSHFFRDNTSDGSVFDVENDDTYLFRELSDVDDNGRIHEHFHAPKLIMDWKIQFESFAKEGETITISEKGDELINIDRAEDEGGPTREFLSKVWKQLGSLKVSVYTAKGEQEFKLFERCSAGVIPMTNESFEIPGNKKLTFELKERARYYYRAIGRIMFRSLVTNHSISSEAMPTFYRNIVFRDCGPEERKVEHREDIIDELDEIDVKFKPQQWIGIRTGLVLDTEDEEIITKENIFTKIIPGYFVKTRSWAINAMKEGLTLNGAVDVFSLFHAMPLPAVSSLVFSKPTVAWDDLKRVLKPKYDTEADATILEIQVDFFDKIFLRVLEDRGKKKKKKKKEKNFLSAFVHFCTGLHYLPSKEADPNFTINIEFDTNEDEMTNESLPMIHTCTKDFRLPRCAYDGDRELFEKKLDQAIELSQGSFGMR